MVDMDMLDTCADCGCELTNWDKIAGFNICEKCLNKQRNTDMKTLKLIILAVVTALSLASCNNEYKPFDAGIKKIQAEQSLDSLDREIQARW